MVIMSWGLAQNQCLKVFGGCFLNEAKRLALTVAVSGSRQNPDSQRFHLC